MLSEWSSASLIVHFQTIREGEPFVQFRSGVTGGLSDERPNLQTDSRQPRPSGDRRGWTLRRVRPRHSRLSEARSRPARRRRFQGAQRPHGAFDSDDAGAASRPGYSARRLLVIPAKNTRDRASALFPGLLYERLDEFGIDFTVLYPSCGLVVMPIEDEELRRATCRAFNMYLADRFREFSDRITPAAVIPMFTPKEAMAELEYAVQTLGLKVAMLGHP